MQTLEYLASEPECSDYIFVPAEDVGQMKGSISSNIVILHFFIYFSFLLCPSFEVMPRCTGQDTD